jgi:agmatinase
MKKITTVADKLKRFNPNDPAADGLGIFGLPFSPEESNLVLVSVPWEVTVSYKGGTAKGPAAILEASSQVDLFEPLYPNGWKRGIAMLPINKSIALLSKTMRPKVVKYLKGLTRGKIDNSTVAEINEACLWMNNWVRLTTGNLLDQNKLVGLIGGDHSTPLGFIQALSERHSSFAILQLDAHCDLRNAYEGFTFSHASIMYNAIQLKQVSKLVQVGIRDFCEDEMNLISKSKKITTFFDADLKKNAFAGMNWKNQCDKIISELPNKVYISFDIDGLDPKLCPNTGTPVPGGLAFEQAEYLLAQLKVKGKKIIGFDLNEVAPGKDEWDANVGARMLFKLCHLLLKAND